MVDQQGTGDIARFKDAGVDKVVIDGSGNVGIGTTNPQQNLHVAGTVLSNKQCVGVGVFDNLTTLAVKGPVALAINATSGWQTYVVNEYNSVNVDRWWLIATFPNQNAYGINMKGNFSRVDDICYVSLKVHTTYSSEGPHIVSSQRKPVLSAANLTKLHVYKNTSTNMIDIWINSISYSHANMIFDTRGTIYTTPTWTTTSPTSSGTYVLIHDTSVNSSKTNLRNGNVGIGTTNPTQKLEVNGFIKQTAVWFYARNGASQISTAYTGFVPFANVLPGSTNFTVNNTTAGAYFTAPIDGIYHFTTSVLNYPTATVGELSFSVDGNILQGYFNGIGFTRQSLSNNQTISSSITIKLSASQVVRVRVVSIYLYTEGHHGYFSGYLACAL